jgi:hypothetical protein
LLLAGIGIFLEFEKYACVLCCRGGPFHKVAGPHRINMAVIDTLRAGTR